MAWVSVFEVLDGEHLLTGVKRMGKPAYIRHHLGRYYRTLRTQTIAT